MLCCVVLCCIVLFSRILDIFPYRPLERKAILGDVFIFCVLLYCCKISDIFLYSPLERFEYLGVVLYSTLCFALFFVVVLLWEISFKKMFSFSFRISGTFPKSLISGKSYFYIFQICKIEEYFKNILLVFLGFLFGLFESFESFESFEFSPIFQAAPNIPRYSRNSKTSPIFQAVPNIPRYSRYSKYWKFWEISKYSELSNISKFSQESKYSGVWGCISPIVDVCIFYIFLCVVLSFRFLRFLRFLRFPTLRKKLYFPIVSIYRNIPVFSPWYPLYKKLYFPLFPLFPYIQSIDYMETTPHFLFLKNIFKICRYKRIYHYGK